MQLHTHTMQSKIWQGIKFESFGLNLQIKIQWNLFIMDALVQEGLSITKRCPLFRGLCKNISVTHKKYYYDDKMINIIL